MEDRQVVVVGDAHITPGQSLGRFRALGNYLLETRPDDVVLMGDFVSMESLSSFDKKGGLRLEGTRIGADVAVGKAALTALTAPITAYNRRRAKNHDKQFTPRIHFIAGNHEHRIIRWWEDDAQMAGTYSLIYEFSPWVNTYTRYGDYLWLNGVGFTHIPFNKVGPVSASGFTVSIAQKVALQSAASVVFGHTHLLDLGRAARTGNDKTIYCLNVGCFFEPEYDPPYIESRLKDWWRGIVRLTIAQTGEFDFQTIGLSTLMSRYT